MCIEEIIEENKRLKMIVEEEKKKNNSLLSINKNLKENIFIDNPSQLYNYKYLNIRLDEEMKRSNRYNLFLSLALVGVDPLKIKRRTNLDPDECMKQLGLFIKTNIRESDIISISGNNIFALVLPETNIEGANILCGRLLEQILLYGNNLKTQNSSSDENIINIGITSYPTDANVLPELISKSHAMLKSAQTDRQNSIYSSLNN